MTTLITASIIAFGVFAFRLLPVSALPRVDFPTIAVTATLPGASADTMAASVAGIIERQLSTIAGISSMSSSSSQGTTQITIQFDLNRNIDAAALDVQTALTIAQRRLPIEMTIPPSFRKVNPADFPVLFVSLGSATLPLSAVNEYGDITIGQALSQIPGVAQAIIYGAQKFAIRVQADPEAAAARGLSLEDIRAAVSRANSSTPVGTLNGPKQDVALQASGQMDKAADYSRVVVAWRNGSPVKLDEVAKIYDSVENDKIATWLNDERAIVIAIQKQPDANTVAVVDAVRAKLPALRAQIPPSVTMNVMLDRSVSVRQAVSDVEETLGIAVCSGDPRDLPVPALGIGHLHSRACGADIAARDLRGHVHAGLLHQQHDAAGVDIVGRFRGRRRHRDAGKHRAPYRARHAALRGGAQGRARDRLHHHLDHVLADRRVHSGSADGRHRRPRVPRIRGDHLGCDRGVGFRVADADADAVRAGVEGARSREERNISSFACSNGCSPRGCGPTNGRSTGCWRGRR